MENLREQLTKQAIKVLGCLKLQLLRWKTPEKKKKRGRERRWGVTDNAIKTEINERIYSSSFSMNTFNTSVHT